MSEHLMNKELDGSVPAAATLPSLDLLFRPESIAVIGATDTPGAVGGQVIENLKLHGYPGRIYPVNPKYAQVHGLTCYPSLAELPSTPDVVAVALPAAQASAVIDSAGALGAPFAVIYASGFAEASDAGAALQRQLSAAARAHGVRLIGPNCQGLMNIAERIHIGFGPPYRLTYRPGRVAVVSQSGAFGNSLIMGINDEGIGLRRYVSTGNEADVGALDCIDAMLEDAGTDVIAGYVEGFDDALPIRRIAVRSAEKGIPIVLWKVGSSNAGARAAASHTANLAGDHRFYRAAFDQLGIVSVGDVGEMADCIRALLSKRRSGGPRIGAVTISGGAGVAMADRAEELGLVLSDFAEATATTLRKALPAFATTTNPLDVTAGALTDPDSLEVALEAVALDGATDMLAIALAAASGRPALTIVRALERLAARISIPIVIAWNAPRAGNEEAFDVLEQANLPVFATPGRAIRGLAALYRFGANLDARENASRSSRACAGRKVRDVRALNEFEAKAQLVGTGIRGPEEAVAETVQQAVAAARRIGYPVVVKLMSAAVAHKSDIGGVRLHLDTDADVAEAFSSVVQLAAEVDPDATSSGVLVQQQISDGVEVIVGARVDDIFGPIVMFGAGGILAELVSDVAFRLAPVDIAEARRMIAQTRVARVLEGVRGGARRDLDALTQAIAALSERIADPGSGLREIEINPLLVQSDGHGVIAGDCLARVSAPAAQGVRASGGL